MKRTRTIRSLICTVLLVLMALSLTACGGSGGSYQSAVDTYAKYSYPTSKSVKLDDFIKDALAGADGGTVADIVKILQKSDDMKDMLESIEDSFKDEYKDLKDTYGKDFKVKIKIEDKEKIDEDDLEEIQDQLREAGESVLESMEEAEDYDKDDWEDMADESGLKVADCKSLYKSVKALGQKLEKAKVTDGYEIEATVSISGKEDDDEIDVTLHVYKVNGKWICLETFASFSYYLGRLF